MLFETFVFWKCNHNNLMFCFGSSCPLGLGTACLLCMWG
jgi:hypothetical protein